MVKNRTFRSCFLRAAQSCRVFSFAAR
jgi:hypothetical protein